MGPNRKSGQPKLRLVLFSSEQTDYRQFEFNVTKLLTVLLLTSAIVATIFVSSTIVSSKLAQAKITSGFSMADRSLRLPPNNLTLSDMNTGKLITSEADSEELEILTGLRAGAESTDAVEIAEVDNTSLAVRELPAGADYDSARMSEYLRALEQRFEKAKNVQAIIKDKFIEQDNQIEHIPSIKPITGAFITDKFGRRSDPFMKRVKHHYGIDLRAPRGTKIYSAASGVVEFTRNRYRVNRGYGRVVIINHGFGYKTLYGHLSKIAVKKGQKVDRWALLGHSGDTGRATGPHLHYEVWHKGRPQNPEEYILD